MIKFVKRKAALKAKPRCLANRVRYIANQTHGHHLNKKVVMPSRNYGCRGESAVDFLTEAKEAFELGELRIKMGSGRGNPTPDLFLELIYASPEKSNPTAEERERIRTKLLAPFRGCYIRDGWHAADLENPNRPKDCKDIDDFHALISARDRFGNATMNRFGDGKQTFKSWADSMDQEICDMLNSTRTVEFHPVHVLHRKNLGKRLGTKLTKLCQIIAQFTAESVTRFNLAEIIGHLTKPSAKNPKEMAQLAKIINDDLTFQDDKVVVVHFNGRKEPNRYRIKKLLLNIAEFQLDLQMKGEEEGFSGGASSGSSGSGGGGSLVPTATSPSDSPSVHPPLPRPAPIAKKAAKKAARKREKSKTKDISPPGMSL